MREEEIKAEPGAVAVREQVEIVRFAPPADADSLADAFVAGQLSLRTRSAYATDLKEMLCVFEAWGLSAKSGSARLRQSPGKSPSVGSSLRKRWIEGWSKSIPPFVSEGSRSARTARRWDCQRHRARSFSRRRRKMRRCLEFAIWRCSPSCCELA